MMLFHLIFFLESRSVALVLLNASDLEIDSRRDVIVFPYLNLFRHCVDVIEWLPFS